MLAQPPMVSSDVRISVVIPHLNQSDFLTHCLQSLMAGRRQPDEIFVVDNGSADMPIGVCDAYDGVVLLQEKTPGPGPARNHGVAQATGDVLAFIDADCTADPDWLYVAAHEIVREGSDILGGDVRIALADPAHVTMLEAYESVFAYRMDLYIVREGFTGTGNLIVRRAIWDAVGAFAGLGTAEDVDWGKRATAAGYDLQYVADMKVYHPARTTFVELWKKWDRQTAHFYEAARHQRLGRVKWVLRAGVMALSPLKGGGASANIGAGLGATEPVFMFCRTLSGSVVSHARYGAAIAYG